MKHEYQWVDHDERVLEGGTYECWDQISYGDGPSHSVWIIPGTHEVYT